MREPQSVHLGVVLRLICTNRDCPSPFSTARTQCGQSEKRGQDVLNSLAAAGRVELLVPTVSKRKASMRERERSPRGPRWKLCAVSRRKPRHRNEERHPWDATSVLSAGPGRSYCPCLPKIHTLATRKTGNKVTGQYIHEKNAIKKEVLFPSPQRSFPRR